MNPSQNDQFMRLQNQIRQNTYSVQDYISELTDWTEDMTQKDADVKQGKGVKEQKKKLPPIRSQKLEQERINTGKGTSYLASIHKAQKPQTAEPSQVQIDEDVKDYKRDITPMPTYYNKWDKFDPDKALDDVENNKNVGYDKTLHTSGKEITNPHLSQMQTEPDEYAGLTEEEKQELQKEKFLKGTSGAKPNTQIVIKGGTNPSPLSQIQSMKNKGNTHFTSLEYEKAIE